MSKFTGKTQGLDPKKLSALRKVLKEAGIEGDIRVNSGLRDAKKAYELYLNELEKFPKLKSALEKLPEGSKKAIRERILRGRYNPKGKSIALYPSGNWNQPGLIKQLTKDGMSAVEAQKISKQVGNFRGVNAGLGSSHLKGEKVDINRSILNKPGVKELLVKKGYRILDEEDKGIWDISFPKPGRKGGYEIRTRKGKQKVAKSQPKPMSKPDMDNKFLIPEDQASIPKWMKKHGYNYEDMKKPDGSWYHPGDAMQPMDPKFEDVKEFEQFKQQEMVEPEVSPMGKQLEGMDMMDMQAPKPDLILPDAPPPNPYGVFAQDQPEFKMAEEQEKRKVLMAKGGEVNPRIPRKEGQPAKSKKHSDLYTDEDPKGTIHGLGFKDVPKAKASVAKIRKSSRSHAHKVQAAVAMEQRAREMGKTPEAAVYRKFINDMKERTKKMKKNKGGEIKYQEGGEAVSDFKLSSIEDIIGGLDDTASKAAQPELQKADQIIQEDVSQQGDVVEQDDLGEQMAAFRSGEGQAMESDKVEEQEKIARDPEASETALPREKGVPGYIMAGDIKELVEARDSGLFPKSVINKEIARRKSDVKKQAGLKRSPSIADIVKVEETKDVVEAPKAPKKPKGDVSKTEPSVRVTSDAEKQKSALERQKAELDAKIQDYQNMESKYDAIDTNRFFNSGGTLNKIISMVAAGFGGYASGRFGGPNVYLNLIDKEVQRDIKQQKLDREDEVAKQNSAYKKIKQLADRYQMAVDNDFAKKKLEMLSKKMDEKVAANRNKLAVEQLKQQDYGRITKPLSRADFTALDFKYPKMKLRDRALVGKDGQVYIVDSADAKKKLEEQIENNTGAVQAIDQLIDITPNLSFFEKLPGAGRVSVNRRLADATRDALVGKLRLELFGPGVMTDTEREQAKKIIGDPGALLELTAPKVAALQNIRWKLKYAERERLRRNGVQVPMSRNDLKVENRLKAMGMPPFAKASARQKREAMDFLIKREKKAMSDAAKGKAPMGWYKGKFWDKDEQGNF
jgi:hypothetical protein